MRKVTVPHYPELSVKEYYEQYKEDEKLMWFMPSNYAKGRQIDRDYFWNVFNTVYPEAVQEIIGAARAQRFNAETEEQQNETIAMSADWFNRLHSVPFKSSKCFLKTDFVQNLVVELCSSSSKRPSQLHQSGSASSTRLKSRISLIATLETHSNSCNIISQVSFPSLARQKEASRFEYDLS